MFGVQGSESFVERPDGTQWSLQDLWRLVEISVRFYDIRNEWEEG